MKIIKFISAIAILFSIFMFSSMYFNLYPPLIFKAFSNYFFQFWIVIVLVAFSLSIFSIFKIKLKNNKKHYNLLFINTALLGLVIVYFVFVFFVHKP